MKPGSFSLDRASGLSITAAELVRSAAELSPDVVLVISQSTYRQVQIAIAAPTLVSSGAVTVG